MANKIALTLAFGLTFGSLSISCKSTSANSGIKSELSPSFEPSALPQQSNRESTEEFRNIFYSLGKGQYSTSDLQKIIYLPPPELLEMKARGENPLDALDKLRVASMKFLPTDLYNYGVSKAVTPVDNPLDTLKSKGPITIIAVPGLCTEFTETFPFHEIVSNANSSLAKKFKAALEASGHPDAKADMSFDFESLSDKSRPLSDLVKAGSFDDADGNPLINIVVLAAPAFSGESFGPVDQNADVYLRRANKYFELMGIPENVYVLGQSRGTPVVLSMISKLEEKGQPWYKNVKGMIALVGITYGTPIADAAFDPKDPLNAALKPLHQLAKDLEYVEPDASVLKTGPAALRNAGHWAKASATITTAILKLPRPAGLKMEKIAPDLPYLDPSLKMIRDIAFDKFNFADLRPNVHFQNVKKFKWLLERATQGLDELRTSTRLAWWKTHTIPEHLNYYAIGAVLPDASTKERGVSPLTASPLTANTKALDYLLLRSNYYDMFRYSKLELNDGQATWERSRFLPELNYLMNPKQKPFRSYYLGTVEVDHWGIGFPAGLRTLKDNGSPFPRSLVAQSIAVFVSRHSED